MDRSSRVRTASLTFRQLQYNHNQLMEEKKRILGLTLEEYFDEVDHDEHKAFLVYERATRSEIATENPGIKVTQIVHAARTKWRALTDEEKEPYHAIAAADTESSTPREDIRVPARPARSGSASSLVDREPAAAYGGHWLPSRSRSYDASDVLHLGVITGPPLPYPPPPVRNENGAQGGVVLAGAKPKGAPKAGRHHGGKHTKHGKVGGGNRGGGGKGGRGTHHTHALEISHEIRQEQEDLQDDDWDYLYGGYGTGPDSGDEAELGYREADERWDGGLHGPYTYDEFYRHYGDVTRAREAWARADLLEYDFGFPILVPPVVRDELLRQQQASSGELAGGQEDGADIGAGAGGASAAADTDTSAGAGAAAAATIDAAAAAADQAESEEVECCGLCDEPGPRAAMKTRFTAKCQPSSHYTLSHETAFCPSCVESWIEAALDDGRVVIKCPAAGCDCRMTHDDLEQHATPAQFERFDALASKDYTAKYEEIMADPAMARWAAANTKQCPTCLQLVNRSFGCNHMACACGANFCYACEGSMDYYTGSNSDKFRQRTKRGVKMCRCNGWEGDDPNEDEETRFRRIEARADFDAEMEAQKRPQLQDSIALHLPTAPALLSLVEFRVDPEDGFAYPRAAFIEHYGSYAGPRRWVLAGVVANLEEYQTFFEMAFPGHAWPFRQETSRGGNYGWFYASGYTRPEHTSLY